MQEDKVAQEDRAAQDRSTGPSHTVLDAACLRMAEAGETVKNRSNEFEVLLLAPVCDLGAVRLAQAAARMAGVQSLGSTTNYLTALNQYMQAVEEAEKKQKAEKN